MPLLQLHRPARAKVRAPGGTLEMLECRIAPASLVNASVVTYKDVDGDLVTLKFTKPILKDAAAAGTILHFDTGSVDGSLATGQQLQTLDLSGLPEAAGHGIGFTLTARHTPSSLGDGYANLGYLDATGVNLGSVIIGGDLGRLSAGTGDAHVAALKSLQVQSLGVYGLGTQASGGTLLSSIHGDVTSLVVRGDVAGASLQITGGGDFGFSLQSLRIGGSLRGADADDSGQIGVSGGMGSVTIGGDLVGSANARTAQLDSVFGFLSVRVGGNIIGGGDQSGAILVAGATVDGKIYGEIGSLTVGRNILGGHGQKSGFVYAATFFNTIKVGGSLVGSLGAQSGVIDFGMKATVAGTTSIVGSIASLWLGGDLQGGDGQGSGAIGDSVAVHNGLSHTYIRSAVIHGSVIGDSYGSGAISANDFTSVVIAGSLRGGAAPAATLDNSESGLVVSGDYIQSLAIHGSVIGGGDFGAGGIDAVRIGSLSIGQDLKGGTGDLSGAIRAGAIKTLVIGGSVYSGSGSMSGSINAYGVVGAVIVKGSVVGTASQPVQLNAEGVIGQTITVALGALTIGGSVSFLQVLGGSPGLGGAVDNAVAEIGPVRVGGDWIASSIAAGVDPGQDHQVGTADDYLTTSGAVPMHFAAIASIRIGGQVGGTVPGGDHFAFEAQRIGALSIGQARFVPAGALALGLSGDFSVRLF